MLSFSFTHLCGKMTGASGNYNVPSANSKQNIVLFSYFSSAIVCSPVGPLIFLVHCVIHSVL